MTRRHSEHRHGFFVETPPRIEARVVHGFSHAVTALETFPDLCRTMSRGIVLRGQPDDCFEYAVEVAGAAIDRGGQIVQRRFFLAFLDQAAGFSHQGRVLNLKRGAIWIAALAW